MHSVSQLSDFRSEATRVLSEIKKGSTFLTVHHYLNNFGEISDFSIVFHINYINAVSRSLELLEGYSVNREDAVNRPYTHRELEVARKELLESFRMTLDGNNTLAKSADSYVRVNNGEGQPIPGIKLHESQDILHLIGFRVHKNILLKGKYPPDNRAAKTIAKDDLRSRLPVGRFTQFKLTPGKFRSLVVNGMTINEEDVLRQSMDSLSK